jgi:hypothetical protein
MVWHNESRSFKNEVKAALPGFEIANVLKRSRRCKLLHFR